MYRNTNTASSLDACVLKAAIRRLSSGSLSNGFPSRKAISDKTSIISGLNTRNECLLQHWGACVCIFTEGNLKEAYLRGWPHQCDGSPWPAAPGPLWAGAASPGDVWGASLAPLRRSPL